MLKKSFLIFFHFFPIMAVITMQNLQPEQLLLSSSIAFGQNIHSNLPLNNEIISSFNKLSKQQLLDTANYFSDKNSTDTALVCYSLYQSELFFILNTSMSIFFIFLA
jgi:hypothetical protein